MSWQKYIHYIEIKYFSTEIWNKIKAIKGFLHHCLPSTNTMMLDLQQISDALTEALKKNISDKIMTFKNTIENNIIN